MAVEDYGTTVSDVEGHLPFSGITASSSPINEALVQKYIQESASKASGLLGRESLATPTNETTLEALNEWIAMDAALKCLVKIGYTGRTYDNLKAKANARWDELVDSTELLPGVTGQRVRSNVDTSTDKQEPYYKGISKKFW